MRSVFAPTGLHTCNPVESGEFKLTHDRKSLPIDPSVKAGPSCADDLPPNGTYFRKVTRCVSEEVQLFAMCRPPSLTQRVTKVSAIDLPPAVDADRIVAGNRLMTETTLLLTDTDAGLELTRDEFGEADFDSRFRFERVEGRLIVMAPSG